MAPHSFGKRQVSLCIHVERKRAEPRHTRFCSQQAETVSPGAPFLCVCGAGENTLSEREWGACAIVGNSGLLKLTEFARSIDSHDTVLRLNVAPTVGHSRRVGHKVRWWRDVCISRVGQVSALKAVSAIQLDHTTAP